jgi:hypothetical protein
MQPVSGYPHDPAQLGFPDPFLGVAETIPLTAFDLDEVIDALPDSNDVYLATAMTPIAVQNLKSFFRKPSGGYILPPPAKIIMPGHSCFFLLFAK